MPALVAIVAPSGPLRGVLEVLRDWSAVGLVEPFVWIEPSMLTDSTVGVLATDGGTHIGTTLQALTSTVRYERVRLLVLAPVIEGAALVSSADEQRIANLLEGSAGDVPVTRVRAVVTRVGDPTTTSDLGRTGWHNVILAPEQSVGPGLGHTVLAATTDPLLLAPAAAATIAGLIGLWKDVPESPLDDEALLPGSTVRLVRSFFRRMQGEALENELRARVTATSESLPLPVEGGAPAIYVQDNALAISTMAKALWERHQDVLQGPRENRKRTIVKPIGLGRALKMFFGFVWAALRNAPQQWYRSTVVRISSRVAGAVHGLVFGDSPAAYAVVVNGVTPDGMPVSWLELSDAADALDAALDEPGQTREHHAISDFSSLWREYTAGALTLADGAERVDGLAPVQIGTRRAILKTVSLCAPPPGSRFDGIPPHLAAHIGVHGVEAYDILAINNLHSRLTKVEQEPGLGLEAGRALEALTTWNNETKGSYAARVGMTLGEAVNRTAAEIKSILKDLKAAGSGDDMPAAIAARQTKLAKTMRIISIVFLLIGVIVGVVFGFGLISGTVAAILAGATVLSWFVTLLVTFYRGQRDLFRLINARQELATQAEILKRNLRQAVRDLRRLTDAYAQYLAWSRVLGVMLASPLGTVPQSSEDGTRLDPDLPLPVRLGSAVVDDVAMDNAVISLRRDVFRIGWLTDPWTELIKSAGSMLGTDGYELREDAEALYRQDASTDGSLLLKWIAVLERQGMDRAVANRLWGEIRDELSGSKKELTTELLSSIVELGKSPKAKVSFDTFMARVNDSSGAVGGQFDLAVLTPAGKSANRAQIERTWGVQKQTGFSQVAVLTQLSSGAPPYEYVAFAEGADTSDSDSNPLSGPTF